MADAKTAAAASQAKGSAAESGVERSRKVFQQVWASRDAILANAALIGQMMHPWRNAAISDSQATDAMRRSNQIINGVAGLCYDTHCAGMLAGNASPSALWMKVTTRKRSLAESDVAKTFLQKLTDELFEDCAHSNAYTSLGLCFGDQGLYGTAAMLVIADPIDPVRCYVFSIGSYGIGQDARGVPNQLARELTMTASQMVAKFGKAKCSEHVRNAVDQNKGETTFDVCHLIAPNDYALPNPSEARFKAWHECYFEKGMANGPLPAGSYLSESGYGSFPVVVPRWELASPNTPWGVGIGIKCLGDVAQLQALTKDEANAVEFGVNPPMQGPGALHGAFLNRKPGGYNSVDVTQGLAEIKPLVPVTLNLSHTQVMGQNLTDRIKEAWNYPLFKQFTGPTDRLPETAYLAQQMFREKVTNLLPVMNQQARELLWPYIERLIQIRIEKGLLLPAGSAPPDDDDIMVVPDELDRADLSFEFEGPFAQAQKAVHTGNTEAYMNFWAQMAAAFPAAASEIVNKIDFYKTMELSADGYSIEPETLRSAEDVAELDEAQAEAMNAQRMAQNVPGAAKAVSDLGNTPTGAGSVLDQLAGAVA